MTDTTSLRRHLKQVREDIPAPVADLLTQRILARLQHFLRWKRIERLAGYLGHRGEIDPRPLLLQMQRQTRVYLPVLHPLQHGRLWFCRWLPGQRMSLNRFGIAEPPCTGSGIQPASHLDVVITPLLGFDAACHRLGMGGGFYDRTFAFRHRRQHIGRPMLIGLAFEAQRLDRLESNPWDVDLDVVITEQRIYARDTALRGCERRTTAT
jgi:5-formyltetrahydrofolate cyclo-ligase